MKTRVGDWLLLFVAIFGDEDWRFLTTRLGDGRPDLLRRDIRPCLTRDSGGVCVFDMADTLLLSVSPVLLHSPTVLISDAMSG